MHTTIFAAVLATGAAAAAVALAPAAAASNSVECTDSGLSSMCTKTGHSAIVAIPGDTSPGNAGFWPFGSGPVPPVFAMD